MTKNGWKIETNNNQKPEKNFWKLTPGRKKFQSNKQGKNAGKLREKCQKIERETLENREKKMFKYL